MKKEIIDVDKEKGTFRVTTKDERWYIRPSKNKTTGLPIYEFVPSVTWICGHYPKGVAFYKWLADKGWNEAEALKNAAGDKGSKIHLAIADLLNGLTIKHDSLFLNKSTDQPEDLSVEEYDAILSFKRWFDETKPEVLGFEFMVWNDQENYAGTVDLKCRIGKEVWIIDVKSGQYVWPEYELQLSAYKHADQCDRLGVIQVGYKRNKNGYKFTEIYDKFPLFLAAKQIWANETKGQTPHQKDYPMEIKLGN